MISRTRLLAVVILVMFSTQFTALFMPSAFAARSFNLVDYSITSSSGDREIYPGSKGVELIVTASYNGSTPAYGVSACIALPSGFSISRGYPSCSPPIALNRSQTLEVIYPGDTVQFIYHIDVDKSVQPGLYAAYINVSYRTSAVGGSLNTEVLSPIVITVYSYPQPEFGVVNVYWSPDAYPGTSSTSMYIVVRNSGNAAILSGSGKVKYPSGVVFPSEVSVNIGAINRGDMYTIQVSGLSIYRNATPGTYLAELYLDLSMRTNDGVTYEASTTVQFVFNITQDPGVIIEVVDYGSTAPYAIQGAKAVQLYAVFRHVDSRSITANSIVAVFSITSGGRFANGSQTSVVSTGGPISYGQTFRAVSDYLIIDGSADIIVWNLTLYVLASRSGSEFWSVQTWAFETPVKTPSVDLRIVSICWNGGEAYPGSSQITLNVVIENYDVYSIEITSATLSLPAIFVPSNITLSSVSIASGSSTVLRFVGISVDPDAYPGIYLANLTLAGIARSGAGFFEFTEQFMVALTISSPPYKDPLELTSIQTVPRTLVANTFNAVAAFTLQLTKPVSQIYGVSAALYLPPGFLFKDGSSIRSISVQQTINYGGFATLSFDGILVPPTMGIFPALIRIRGISNLGGAEYWFEQFVVVHLDVTSRDADISIADYGWRSGYSTPNVAGGEIYITLQSLEKDYVETVIIEVGSETDGASFYGGVRNTSIVVFNGRLYYGDVISVTIGGLDLAKVNTDRIELKVRLTAIIRCAENTQTTYILSRALYIALPLLKDLRFLMVTRTYASYRGAPSPLLPTAKDVTLTVGLANLRPETVTSMSLQSIGLPRGLNVTSVGGSCFQGIAPGSECLIQFTLDVDGNAVPGIYALMLDVQLFVRSGSSIIITNQTLHIPIAISDPRDYIPDLSVLSAYWGRVGQPVPVYGFEQYIPLTVVLVNSGRYTAANVELRLRSENSAIQLVVDSNSCPNVQAGTTCTATFYVSFKSRPDTAEVAFALELSYTFSEYGAFFKLERIEIITLSIEDYEPGLRLNLVDVSWQNNWLVFPGSENASLVLTFVNMWPYTIRGVNVTLYLFSGFSDRYGSKISYQYVAVPIRALDTFAVTFPVSVSPDVRPGRHVAKVSLEYFVDVGGSLYRDTEEFDVDITVNDPRAVFEMLTPYWLNGLPEPPALGAILVVPLRNNLLPQVSGLTLKIKLPDGFTCSLNNQSEAAVYASNIAPQTLQIQTGIAAPVALQQLQQILGAMQQLPQQYFQRGDMAYFYILLNIYASPGIYIAEAVLEFKDQWGSTISVPIAIPIAVLGSTKLVEIETPPIIEFDNGIALMNVTIRNKGSAPIVNVYIGVQPLIPIALPRKALYYVEEIAQAYNFSVELVYNPASIMAYGAATAVRYLSLPISFVLIFQDYSGTTRSYNYTVSVIIEPFVFLKVVDIKAVQSGARLTVSGTIVNYGLSTARNTEVYVYADSDVGYSFIGDIDPAGQTAFRIDIELQSGREISNVTVGIAYMDDYGRRHWVNTTVMSVAALQPQQQQQTSAAGIQQLIHPYGTAALVLAAIGIVVAALLFIQYRKVSKKVSEEAGRIPTT